MFRWISDLLRLQPPDDRDRVLQAEDEEIVRLERFLRPLLPPRCLLPPPPHLWPVDMQRLNDLLLLMEGGRRVEDRDPPPIVEDLQLLAMLLGLPGDIREIGRLQGADILDLMIIRDDTKMMELLAASRLMVVVIDPPSFLLPDAV